MSEKKKSLFDQFMDYVDEFEKRFDETFYSMLRPFRTTRPSWDPDKLCLVPLVEVQEYPEEVVVTADLPYVDKENIDVNATETSLDIDAKMRTAIRFERWGTIQREISFNCYHKSIKLPSRVDPEKAKAEFKGGILRITLPKTVSKQKIEID
ncbi:MAG: Hsp20/alpha crystallin family protein [Candidatus Jordarchaeum sp.]|uniref:Hsp20/alpha crystallin family protein n=1 Tax=Candidatus Jordarchaeum sp. TaxID=2823881 RepID=UPI004049EE1E